MYLKILLKVGFDKEGNFNFEVLVRNDFEYGRIFAFRVGTKVINYKIFSFKNLYDMVKSSSFTLKKV